MGTCRRLACGGMQMLNLDTHILVFALIGDLQERERALLEENEWSVSGIVLWELAKLAQLGRLEVDLDDRQIARILDGIRQWPIDLTIARMSTRLDFRSDPAVELIAATSVVHDVPLLTRDAAIRRSRMVPLA